MKPNKQLTFEQAFDILQLKNKNILVKMANAKKYEDACTALEEMKEIIKKQKRTLAKKYHPDIGGDAEKFKEMIEICDSLLGLQVQTRRPPPTFTIIIRTTNYGKYDNTTTTNSWWSTF